MEKKMTNMGASDIKQALQDAQKFTRGLAYAEAKMQGTRHSFSPTDLSTLANTFLARFGFKGPFDLIHYLQSPSGQSIQAMIGKHLIEQLKADEFTAHLHSKKTNLRLQIALLLLGLAFARHEKARDLNRFIQEQINYLLKLKREETGKKYSQAEILKELIETYMLAADEIIYHLLKHLDEYDALEAQCIELEAEKVAIEKKYEALREEMEALLKQDATALDKKLGELKGRHAGSMQKITDTLQPSILIDVLTPTLAAALGDRAMYRIDGTLTDSLVDAYFLFPRTKELIVKDGVTYVVDKGLVFSDLSQEQKMQAATEFQTLRLKTEYMPAHRRIEHERNRDLALHSKRLVALQTRIDSMQETTANYFGQLQKIQAAQAAARTLLQTLDPTATLTPTPRPTRSSRVTDPIQSMLACDRAMERFMRMVQHTPLSARGLQTLADLGCDPTRLQLRVGDRISPQTMQSLMRTRPDILARSGTTAMSPLPEHSTTRSPGPTAFATRPRFVRT